MEKSLLSKHFCFKFVGLLCIMALSACGKGDGEGQKPPPMAVSTITVVGSNHKVFTTLSGRVSAIKDAKVLARVTGNIESVNFQQGSQVKAGDLLFTIDPKPYKAAYNEAVAALKQAQASAASSNALVKRYKGLVSASAVSRQEYDNAVATAGQANATVEQAKAALETAAINLGYTKVTSPIDGIVGAALVTEGALVSAVSGTPLALVQQFDEVYVDFNQSASDLAKLRSAIAKGDVEQLADGSTEVDIVTEGEVFPNKGKLLFTGITVNSGTGQVALRALVPNQDHILLPGMYVSVRLPLARVSNALMVPNQALQRTSTGQSQLYLVKDNKVASAIVQPGDQENGLTVINSGIEAGDQVIVEGFTKIRPGQDVNPLLWKAKQDKPTDSGQSEAPKQTTPEGRQGANSSNTAN